MLKKSVAKAFENENMCIYIAISVDDKNLFILPLKRFICLNVMKVIYIFARKLDRISLPGGNLLSVKVKFYHILLYFTTLKYFTFFFV